MIVLYILLGIVLFLLFSVAFIIFIPFKTYIQGSYWDNDLHAMAEFYWIKYIFGARIRLLEMEKLKIVIWFIGIPIPFKISLKKKEEREEKKQQDDTEEIISVNEKDQRSKSPKEKNNFRKKIEDIIKIKDIATAFLKKNWSNIKQIFVSYVTFSIEYLELELGLDDPAKTGKIAGNLYTALEIVPVKRVNLSWNFQKQTFNIDAGIKIIMKFYGILLTLLKLYRFYKRNK